MMITQNSDEKIKEPILFEEDADVTYVTINKPKEHNCLNSSDLSNIIKKLENIQNRNDIKIVVFQSIGKTFCAGLDLEEISQSSESSTRKILDLFTHLTLLVKNLKAITIAKIQGPAIAGGCQLTAICDIALSKKRNWFALPGPSLGLIRITPMVVLSRLIPQKKAFYHIFSGDKISAVQAADIGLISDVIHSSHLDQHVQNLIGKWSSYPPSFIIQAKKDFYSQLNMSFHEAHDYISKRMYDDFVNPEIQNKIKQFMKKNI